MLQIFVTCLSLQKKYSLRKEKYDAKNITYYLDIKKVIQDLVFKLDNNSDNVKATKFISISCSLEKKMKTVEAVAHSCTYFCTFSLN